jgi:hypothetical protein
MMWAKASLAFSAEVTLAWDPPTDSSIEGYMVFSRSTDQAYDYNAPSWQGSATTCTLSDLDFSQPTYFVVRAVDGNGNMSADSNEAVYNPPQGELDSDGDGMPDEWEIRYGLDPSRNDASEDLDGDSIANIDEFRLGSNPAAASDVAGPAQPEWMSPETGTVTASLTPELATGPFSGAQADDVHLRTQWQIVRSDDGLGVFDVISESYLTELPVPQYILEQDAQYFCRVRFIDNLNAASPWSELLTFETPLDGRDSDSDGIPDDQAVNESLDLNEDGVADDLQPDEIKSAYSEPGGGVIAVQLDDPEKGAWISALQVESPEAASNSLAGSDPFLFGVIGYKLQVPKAGDSVSVTIILPRSAPVDATWYQADSGRRGKDYDAYTSFSADRKSVLLELEDGGDGDLDGIANGMIVHHGGLGLSPEETSSDSGSNSGSCFIGAACGPDVRRAMIEWLLRKIDLFLR